MIVWGLELRDSVSVPANAAAAAMGTAADQARVLQRAMQGAQAQLTRASALGDVAAVRKAAANYHVLEEALNAIPPEFRHVEDAAEQTKSVLSSVLEAEILRDVLERVGEAALNAGKEMVEMAIESGEAVRRLKESLGTLVGGGEEAGAAVLGMLRDLEKEVPQSEAQIGAWARQLEAAGVTDMSRLRESIKAIAGAEALVEGGGTRLQTVLAQLNEASVKGTKVRFSASMLAGTGVTEEELLANLGMTPQAINLARKQGTLTGTQLADAMVKAVNAKSAGPLAAQMGEISTMAVKAKDAVRRLFEDIDTGPLAEGMKEAFSVLDTAQPSGVVLRDTLTGAFKAIFGAAGKVFSMLKDGFLHIIIWGLEAAIALKTVHRWFANEFPAALNRWMPAVVAASAFIGTLLVASLYAAIAGVVTWAVTTIPAAIVATGIWIASMAAAAVATIAATWPILAIAAAVALVAVGIYELVRHWPEIKTFFVNLATGALEAAGNFVQGFVNGIRNGVGLVIDAVKNMGTAAWTALKGALGIHSPSTLMMTAGLQTSEGFAKGITSGEGHVEQAAIGMSTAAYLPAKDGARGSPGADGASAGGGQSMVFNFGGVTVHIDASHAVTAQEHRQIVEEEFGSLAERLALMIGSAPEPA